MNAKCARFPGDLRYRKLGPALRERFGEKIHKVTLRGGFGCPNRDGRVGSGGCIFCSENALLPAGGPAFGPIEQQLDAGCSAMAARTGARKFIAYFQDQTATDADIDVLSDLYSRAISDPRIVALSVGTRPDWLPPEVLELLGGLSRKKPVMIELGLQSASDRTLRSLNRGHCVADFSSAVERSHRAGLEVIAHVILDLPGEDERDRARTAACLNRLAVEGVKIHNLYVLEGTPLAARYRAGMFRLAPLLEYAQITAGFIEMLDARMVIHRLSGEGPAHLMIAPEWGRDKRRITGAIEQALDSRAGWQGKRTMG